MSEAIAPGPAASTPAKGGGAPLPLAAVMAFAAASIPIAALQLAAAVHLPRYFASSVGLSLTLVGSAFAIVRFIDIPIDALLGVAMDRTRGRFGRYRVWMALGAPVLMAGLYLLVAAPPGVGRGYLIGALLTMYVGYSMVFLAHMAWAATLAPAYEARSQIFGAVTGLGVAGAIAVLVIPIVLAGFGASDGAGVQAMIWFLIAATPATVALALWRTPERIAPDHAKQFKPADYLTLALRPNVLRLLAADLFVTLGPGWMAALYLFYAKDAAGFGTTAANILLVVYIAAGFAGAPLVAWLAGWIGKHRALIGATVVYSLALASGVLVPYGRFPLAIPSMFVAGAMYTACVVMVRALTGDIADEVRLASGREWTGLMYALTNATSKLGSAGAIWLSYSALAAVGYDALEGATNSGTATASLKLVFLAGPICFLLLGGACFVGYGLGAARHAEIRRELDARDAAVSAE